jgi:hypothetical protein
MRQFYLKQQKKEYDVKKKIKVQCNASTDEISRRKKFLELFKSSPIPDNEILANLGLFMKRQDMSGILFKNEVYKKILDVHGIVVEFGVRWGQNLALFESFRGIYEPFNHSRRIVGFDTFEGFPSVHKKDGNAGIISKGAYPVTAGYKNYLEEVLNYHEQESPISNIRKYDLIKGDAVVEIKKYLAGNPETIIALAYFDFDIYKPTKECLKAIIKHLTKGSIIVFDQLNVHHFPGETLALKEVLGLDKFCIRRCPYSSVVSYIVIE